MTRRGMTLIELLVVIAIIAILVGLLVPAVQQVRESASRTQCANNLKQLGLALHQYHGVHGKFPPGAEGPGINPAWINLKHHSLGSYLLPYLEQESLFKQYRWDISWFDGPNQPVVTKQLKIWQCASAPPNRTEDGSFITVQPPKSTPFTAFAACGDYAGTNHVDAELEHRGLIDPPSGPRGDNGHALGVFPLNGAVRIADIRDGSSNTIMMAECAGRPQLWQGRRPVANVWLSGGGWASRNLLWGRGATADGAAFFGDCAINCTNDREVYSFHSGGANVLFADGGVRFLRTGVRMRLLAGLITRAGGEVVSAGEF